MAPATIRYTTIFKILGLASFPEGTENVRLLARESPAFTATIVANPDPHYLHVDRSAAVGMQLLRGGIDTLDAKERVAAEIDRRRSIRAAQARTSPFLVFEGETDFPPPDFEARGDTDEFAVCFDAVSKAQVREQFQPYLQSVIAAVSLSLGADAERRIEKMGDVVYLVNPNDGKPIYTFTPTGRSLRVSINPPLSQDLIAESSSLASKLATDKALQKTIRRFVDSLDNKVDELEGFTLAWSALEMFINVTFRSTYESQWFALLENAAPASAKPLFRDEMRPKWGLGDKFRIIASLLDPGA